MNVDGNTIWVEITGPGTLPGGTLQKIRMMDIDSPKSKPQPECFLAEANEFAHQELPVGSSIYLLSDTTDLDNFKRPLRYIWREDGELYNEAAVKGGFARLVPEGPTGKYATRIKMGEEDARSKGLGVWTACKSLWP